MKGGRSRKEGRGKEARGKLNQLEVGDFLRGVSHS